MIRTYYIGNQEFIIKSPEELPFLNWDRKFLMPVMPIETSHSVSIHLQDRQIPVSNTRKDIDQIQYWIDEEIEYRSYGIYDSDGQEAYVSSLSTDGRVDLYITKKRWALVKDTFDLWYYIHLEELLLRGNALILHSASIIYKGKAILFTAPSGTGKSTQTDLWHRYRHEVVHLNGDRTLLQWTADGWYACGYPTCGSSMRCEQTAVLIHGIAIVHRSILDEVVEISPLNRIMTVYSQCLVPNGSDTYVNFAMNLVEQLIASEKVVQLNCTMKESAVNALEKYLELCSN